MDVGLTPEQRLLQQSARDLFAGVWSLGGARAALDGAAIPDLRPALAGSGMLSLLSDGAEVLDLALVAEQAGRVLLPSPLIATAARAVLLLEGAVAARGSGATRAASLLAEVTAGALPVCVLDGELRLDPELGTVSGRCSAAIDGAVARLALAKVATDDGQLLLAIPVDEHVRLAPRTPIDPTRSMAVLTLDGAPVEMVLDGDTVTPLWERALHVATVVLAAEGLGTVARCVQMGVAYARERHAFGRAIGSFQAIKHALVDAWVQEEMLRSLVWLAAWRADADRGALALHANAAKALAADTVELAAETLIQVHGGIGFTWEHDAHLLWRRAKVDRLLLGDAAGARDTVARLALTAVAR